VGLTAVAEPSRPDDAIETGELIALIDRFEALLESSDVSELEVEVGDVALVLRKPEAFEAGVGVGIMPRGGDEASPGGPAAQPADEPSGLHAVVAPLTGIFYSSPAPGAAPYVTVGGEVNVGQVIGLIEAMKLFNEIKSDVSGRVARLVAESGTLVKAKQPLIEVEPA
jgi:acetyl-CoA carboxylase biotin carboxyl carrier protein